VKFFGGARPENSNERFDFDGDSDQDADPGIFKGIFATAVLGQWREFCEISGQV